MTGAAPFRVGNWPTPAGKPQVRTVDHMLKLFNHILTHAPEYDDTGLVGTPVNAILDSAMGTRIATVVRTGEPHPC